jgi:hypothetical protein
MIRAYINKGENNLFLDLRIFLLATKKNLFKIALFAFIWHSSSCKSHLDVSGYHLYLIYEEKIME